MREALASSALDVLCSDDDEMCATLSAVLIAAHPDDETVSAGARLAHLRDCLIVHVTDGAPRNMQDASQAGFATREDYARARRDELESALSLIGIGKERTRMLGAIDQEASLDLVGLARRVARLLRETSPVVVLTHPYEGGHPDHDATAFIVHAARQLLARERVRVPDLIEFTSYHAKNGGMSSFEFLPSSSVVRTSVLTAKERVLKRDMLFQFVTQQKTIAPFPVEFECFRPAPEYDFTIPPHAGKLHYENYDWGMRGEEWRAMVRKAVAELGIQCPL